MHHVGCTTIELGYWRRGEGKEGRGFWPQLRANLYESWKKIYCPFSGFWKTFISLKLFISICARSQESLRLGEVLKEDATTQNLKQEAEFTVQQGRAVLVRHWVWARLISYRLQGTMEFRGGSAFRVYRNWLTSGPRSMVSGVRLSLTGYFRGVLITG